MIHQYKSNRTGQYSKAPSWRALPFFVCVPLVFLIMVLSSDPVMGQINDDEEVILFPSIARRTPDRGWSLPVQGWVFEPEVRSFWRRWLLRFVARRLDLPTGSAGDETFKQRASMFLVDNERGKVIRVEAGGAGVESAKSGSNGHFSAELQLPASVTAAEKGGPWLRTHTTSQDGRRFEGLAQLASEGGVSVISDIDDTIKVSHVLDRKKLLEATFLKPFLAFEGMSAAYSRWASQGILFHYVSGSPWQLYPSLVRFIEDAGFPMGSMHLRLFRIKDQSFWDLFKPPFEQKVQTIETLIASDPDRRFILVGDSTEVDPEVYGEMARRHPERIVHIFIRNIEGRIVTDERAAEAFADIPAGSWTLFTDATALLSFSPDSD